MKPGTRAVAWRQHLLQLLAWGLAACGPAAAAPPAAGSGPAPAAHEAGRAVYNFRCYFCHGYSGDARTLAATYLQPPPRDFTRATGLTPQAVLQALQAGRPGTAMKPFAHVLSAAEMQAVAGFVMKEFVRDKARNTAYHTPQNGWPDHQRHAVAFPFATGERALDEPPDTLDERARRGRRLFMAACISCHDRGRVIDEGPAWSARPLSYPRMGFVPGDAGRPPVAAAAAVDAVSSASVYALHDVPPRLAGLSVRERRGERLFQTHCAFCHGADGTGKNWIGQFMEPKARDLTQFTANGMPPQRLRQTIRDGLPGTSMPAWRSVLRPAEVDAVAAYVSRAFLRPAP